MQKRNQGSNFDEPRTIIVTVVAVWNGEHRSVVNDAAVHLFIGEHKQVPAIESAVLTQYTDDGRATFTKLEEDCYTAYIKCGNWAHYKTVKVKPGCTESACLEISLNLNIAETFRDPNCEPIPCDRPRQRDQVEIMFEGADSENVTIIAPGNFRSDSKNPSKFLATFSKVGTQSSAFKIILGRKVDIRSRPPFIERTFTYHATEPRINQIEGNVGATLSRTATEPTDDVALWVAIRNSTEALSFNNYLRFMDWIFCGTDDRSNLKTFARNRFENKRREYVQLRDKKRVLPFTDTDAYRVVKAATEAFVMVNCGVHGEPLPFTVDGDRDLDSEYLGRRDIPPPGSDLHDVFTANYLETVDTTSTLPYLAVIRRKLPDIPIKRTLFEDADPHDKIADNCFGLLQEKLQNPCFLELIWSYWHEEGMLVQTANAISWRFQNRRSGSPRDPLANLELDPLRPLNNLLWGYIQDEQHRLTVMRRNYEYDHHYGLRLEGQAVQQFNPADTRSKFLEAFHHLLRLCTVFYKQDDDTTVKADAFPVLNALKETHLVLSQGAHNQFGDLPSTARIEMLMQQWLLARPEFREVLPTRIMVAYPEPWMDRVDAMKRLQGWTDTSVLHFRNLGLFGEQILLAIRWGHWSDVQEPVQAFNWVRFFRPQVQGYIHAYRAVTGVDLASETVDTKVDVTMPSILLKRRLALQQRAS